MNRTYKLVWNTVSGSWVVASEVAKGHKKSKTIKMVAVLLGGMLAGQAYAASGAAIVLPSGESVAFGSATFDRGTPLKLTVNQTSNKLITNWNSFDVGSAATVQFIQPNANSVVLNRVTSASPTTISGKVSANGQFMLVNPSGVLFSAGSQVSASSITASTLQIENTSVAGGTYIFNRGNATGTVENRGTLTASAGSVSLLAPGIKNSGSIIANGGNVALLSANQVSAGAITQASSIAGSIQQSGTIQATQVSSNGGRILITGDKSQASSKVALGGSLTAATTIDVNAKAIEVTSALALNGSSNLSADDSIVFGADTTVATDKALHLTHGSDTGEGYFLDHAARVNLSGAAAAFSVNGESYTVVQDLLQLQGMQNGLTGKYVVATDLNGNGADFEPVGPYIGGIGDVGPFKGTFDGLGHVISNLRLVQGGYNDMGLFGATENATIRNIGLEGFELAARNTVGTLVGVMTGGSISNSYARNSTVTRSSINGGYDFGGLVGFNNTGTINNSYADVTVTGTEGFDWNGGNDVNLGGLVGNNAGGTINNSYASGQVVAYDLYNNVRMGGLVGQNNGIINNSYASGQINDQTTQAGTIKGGLVAGNAAPWWNPSAEGITNNSYWNTDSTGVSTSAGGNGLTTAQSLQASSFNRWSIDAEGGTGSTWRIYEGSTAPLLRSFLKQTWASTTNSSKTYDGTTAITSSHNLAEPVSLMGSATYITDSRNAGAQIINIRDRKSVV
jgi:filamentous hemagglutinin family protein